MAKIIVTIGCTFSGIGKGIASASLGFLLSLRGYKVTSLKFDPYLNINSGDLSPNEHGEVYVLPDRTECDQDMGHTYRFIGCHLDQNNITTSGRLYKELLEEVENGKFLGSTVQIIPDFTNKIIDKINFLTKESNFVMVEIGGTVSNIETAPFLEAIRQLKQNKHNDVLIILVAPILWLSSIKEYKTKPLQTGVKELQSFGIYPEILLCRSEKEVPSQILDKVAGLTNVPRDAIFDCPNTDIYRVPIEFYNRNIDSLIVDKFSLKRNSCGIHKYKDLVEKYLDSDLPEVNIGIISKYHNYEESYTSLKESLYHAGVANNVRVKIDWISAEDIEKGNIELLKDLHGMIIPGGFDKRGSEGKIIAITYAREHKIPMLGICLGLQLAVIDIARSLLGIKEATSEEFYPESEYKFVHFIPGQENIKKKCGTMRLGDYACELDKNSISYSLYKKKTIHITHRHRYEINEKYIKDLEKVGFKVVGRNPESHLVEIMELENHPFFIGTQGHIEFKSRLVAPAPLFVGLVTAAIRNKNESPN